MFDGFSIGYMIQTTVLLNFKVNNFVIKMVSDTLNVKVVILAYLKVNTLR